MAAAVKAITCVGLTICMSALACLMGCGHALANYRAISYLAHSKKIALSKIPSCHHSHSSTPSHKKQDSSSVSCCLPGAISQKSTPTKLELSTRSVSVSHTNFHFTDKCHFARKFAEKPLPYSGRDTLLETHLLRI